MILQCLINRKVSHFEVPLGAMVYDFYRSPSTGAHFGTVSKDDADTLLATNGYRAVPKAPDDVELTDGRDMSDPNNTPAPPEKKEKHPHNTTNVDELTDIAEARAYADEIGLRLPGALKDLDKAKASIKEWLDIQAENSEPDTNPNEGDGEPGGDDGTDGEDSTGPGSTE